jgi:muconolactone D-isomerase
LQSKQEKIMLFYIQMRWNMPSSVRLSPAELRELELPPGKYAQAAIGRGLVKSIYKVTGQQRVIAIVDLTDPDELYVTILNGLPMSQYLEVEAIWAVRDYELFIADLQQESQNIEAAST